MKTTFYSFIITITCYGQENYGSLNSNYQPTNSVWINPSSILDAKTRIDINVLDISSYFMNNLIYLPNTSINNLIKNKDFNSIPNYKINNNANKYHLYSRTRILGPGFTVSQGNHGFGISTGIRNITDIRNLSDGIVETFISNEETGRTEFSGKNISITSITLGEVKLSYAYTFLKKKRELFMGGISISKLIPIQAFASKIFEIEGEMLNNRTGNISNMYGDNAIMYYGKVKGILANKSIDIGFTYQRMLSESFDYYPNSVKNNCRKNNYLYKIGISIMDIGNIKFKMRNVDYLGVSAKDYQWEKQEIQLENITGLSQFHDKQATYKQKDSSFVFSLNKVRLPSLFSTQLDYNLWKNKIYINFTIVQRFWGSKTKFISNRANSLAITPRFETKFFEFSLPLSLYEYRYPQIGANIRLWMFTLGSDRILSWFLKNNLFGADLYFSLKIPIFYHPKCRDGRRDQLNFYPKWYSRKQSRCGY